MDMPERFLLDSKMVGKRTRIKTKTGEKKKKEKKERCRLGKGQRPRKRGRERNPVILFIMCSNGGEEKRMG